MTTTRTFSGTRSLGARLAVVAVTCAATLGLGAGQALAYGYEYSYNVADRVGAESAFGYVKANFETVFPAAGPRSDCGRTLYVGLECDLVGVAGKGRIRVEEVGSRHFVLRSLPGHAEGANKVINFTLTNNYEDPDDETLRLEVTASGEDNTWQKVPLTKRGNRAVARDLWSRFADRIAARVESGDIPLCFKRTCR